MVVAACRARVPSLRLGLGVVILILALVKARVILDRYLELSDRATSPTTPSAISGFFFAARTAAREVSFM